MRHHEEPKIPLSEVSRHRESSSRLHLDRCAVVWFVRGLAGPASEQDPAKHVVDPHLAFDDGF